MTDQSTYLFGDEARRDPLTWLLRRLGWQQQSESPGRYAVWGPPGDRQDVAVIAPLDSGRGDYVGLYERAIRDLAEHIGGERFAALSNELAADVDDDLAVTSWRRHSNTAPGTIPWLHGQQVHEAINQQLIAAAKSAVAPLARLGRSGEYFAKEFMSATILAPSGVGSYIVNAMTPLHRTLPTSAAPQSNLQPMERAALEGVVVLQRLESALSAIEAGLAERDETAAVSMLREQARRGVSFELATGLAQFVAGEEASITIPKDAWSSSSSPREFAFRPDHTHILVRLADALKGDEPATNVRLTGIVTKLEHEPGADEYKVRLFTTSQGPVRRVSLHVTESDYAKCLNAHRESLLVRVDGELSKEGRLWNITDPQQIQILDPDQVAQRQEEEDLLNLVEFD